MVEALILFTVQFGQCARDVALEFGLTKYVKRGIGYHNRIKFVSLVLLAVEQVRPLGLATE